MGVSGETFFYGEWTSPCRVFDLLMLARRQKPGFQCCKLFFNGVELKVHQHLKADDEVDTYVIQVVWALATMQKVPHLVSKEKHLANRNHTKLKRHHS
jgi:hypothetical protein